MSTHRYGADRPTNAEQDKFNHEVKRLLQTVRQHEEENAPLRIGVLLIPFNRFSIEQALDKNLIQNHTGKLHMTTNGLQYLEYLEHYK